MDWFIWNMNTFQGRFAQIPESLPKETLVGAYGYSLRDLLTRHSFSVKQNAVIYSVFISFLFSGSLFSVLFKDVSRNFLGFRSMFLMLSIILLGLWARLFFAYHTTCNQDLVWWYGHLEQIEKTGHIYKHTSYNYSPFWYYLAKTCYYISNKLSFFTFMFVVRAILTVVDLANLMMVINLAKLRKMPIVYTSAAFFLNPISIIITGYHGQIDTVSIFFLLTALYLSLKYGRKSIYIGWFMLTLASIVKHQIIFQIPIFLAHVLKSNKRVVLLFLTSIVLFLLSFGTFWIGGREAIIKNVFAYGGMSQPYGFICLHFSPFAAAVHKYVFIFLLFGWPFLFKTKDLLKSSLVGMLVLLVFTSGISTQQFVLPVALGALQPNIAFGFYTMAVSFFLFGNLDELKIPFFGVMSWNYVWFAVFIWFLYEINQVLKPKSRNQKSLVDF